jgi:tetratricopeptide (TPR) repeat protein
MTYKSFKYKGVIVMDTHTSIPNDLQKLFSDWLLHIRSRDPESANQTKKEVVNVLDVKESNFDYLLLDARHHILLKDYNEAKVKLEKLGKNFYSFSNLQKYYFYLFNGDLFYSIGHYDKALHNYLEAGSFLDEISNEIEHAEYHYRIGTQYFQLGYASSSVSHAEKAYKIFIEHKEYITRTYDCKVLLALSYTDMHNYQVAASLYEELAEYCEDIDNPEYKMGIYRNLGILYSIQGKVYDAIKQFKMSVSLCIKGEDILPSYYLLSEELFKAGENHEALEILNKGLELANKVKNEIFLYRFLILKGKYVNKELEEESYLKGIMYFKEKELYDFVERYSIELADLYFANGKYKNAVEYYRLAKESRDKFSMRSKIFYIGGIQHEK